MPFKSKAQRRWMYANHPEMAKEWEEHTTKGSKLPEHVKKSSMNTQQAYINGFFKRAKEHGVDKEEALEMLHKTEKHEDKEKPKSFIEKMQEKNKGGGMKLMRLSMMRNLLQHKTAGNLALGDTGPAQSYDSMEPTQSLRLDLNNVNPKQLTSAGSNIINPVNFNMDSLANQFQNQGVFNNIAKRVTGATPYPAAGGAGNYLKNVSTINKLQQGVK